MSVPELSTHQLCRSALRWLLYVPLIWAISASQAQVIQFPNPYCPYEPSGGLEFPDAYDEQSDVSLSAGTVRVLTPNEYQVVYGLGVFGVAANEPILIRYGIKYFGSPYHDEKTDVPIRLFAILNGQLLVIGSDGSLYQDHLLPWRELTVISFVIPADFIRENAIHDLVVIGLARDDIPEIGYDPAAGLYSGRAILITGDAAVGDPYVVGEILPAGTNLTNPPPGVDRVPIDFALEQDDAGPWLRVELGQTSYFDDYTSAYASYDPNGTPVALVIIEDGTPIPVNEHGDLVFYGQVPPGVEYAETWFPIEDTASKRRDITVFRIDYPGMPLCVPIDPGLFRMYGFRWRFDAR